MNVIATITWPHYGICGARRVSDISWRAIALQRALTANPKLNSQNGGIGTMRRIGINYWGECGDLGYLTPRQRGIERFQFGSKGRASAEHALEFRWRGVPTNSAGYRTNQYQLGTDRVRLASTRRNERALLGSRGGEGDQHPPTGCIRPVGDITIRPLEGEGWLVQRYRILVWELMPNTN